MKNDWIITIPCTILRKYISTTMASVYYPKTQSITAILTSCSKHGHDTHGEVDVTLGIRRTGTFRWTFVVAAVTKPLLGLDFLCQNKLIVDCERGLLIDRLTSRKIVLKPSDVKPVTFSVNQISDIDPRAASLLDKYPVLLLTLQLNSNLTQSKTRVTHCIRTGNNVPVYSRFRPLTGEKYKITKDEFQFLLNAGIICRSESVLASPLHLVPKRVR